jgi:hypothetical protein
MNKGDKSMYKWGAIASLTMGTLFIYIGIAIPLDPVERYRGEEFWQMAAELPTFHATWRFAFFLIGLLALALIPAVVRLVRPPNGEGEAILHWSTIVAYIGSALLAIDMSRGILLLREHLTVAYATNDVAYQIATKVAFAGGTDAQGIFQFGGVGLWYFVVSYLGYRGGKLPRLLGYVGMAAGIGYMLAMITGFLDLVVPGTEIYLQAIVAMIAGVIAGPIFHIWLGRVLWRVAHPVEPVEVSRPLPAG